MQPFDGKVHRLPEIQQLLIQLCVHRVTQYGVAKKSGGNRVQISIVLLADRVGRFVKKKKLVLEGCPCRKAHFCRPVQCAGQQIARAKCGGGAVKLAKKKQHSGFKWNITAGFGHNAHGRVGITRMPARELHSHSLIKLVAGIPAQHHVTKSEAFIERSKKLFLAQVFASHNAVDIK